MYDSNYTLMLINNFFSWQVYSKIDDTTSHLEEMFVKF